MPMIPEKIDRYEVIGELGRGGMATVYRAHDPRFQREVAIKVLPREFLHDPTFKARFEREAHTIAALEHPAIVPVYDFGEQNGQPYLVMRYMPGGSLSDRLKGGALTLRETAMILGRLASSLTRAHEAGVIHRDLKPQNILFDQYDNAFLSDFGSVQVAQSGTALTGDGIIGTPAYMSPEQAKGDQDLDGRSDIYALGAILFEMLTGKQPYDADTPMGVAVKHITEPVPRILEVKADLPPALEMMISRAMAKDPKDRYATPLTLSEAFDAVANPTVESSPVSDDTMAADLKVEPLIVEQETLPDLPPSSSTEPEMIPAGITDPGSPEVDPWYSPPKTEPKKAGGWLGIAWWIWITGAVILGVGACGLVLIGGGTWAVLQGASNPTPSGSNPSPVAETGNAILFEDDFSDTSSGWDQYADEETVTDYAPGGYRIFVNTPESYSWANPYLQLTDVLIEVETRKLGGPDDNDFGVICRYQDVDNFYFFVISSDGFFSINKYVDGNLEIVGRDQYGESAAIRPGTGSNQIRASCKGDTLELVVNGSSLMSVQDADFPSGDVGLIAGTFSEPGADILFQNFKVFRPAP